LIDKKASSFYRRFRAWVPPEVVGSGFPTSDMPRHLGTMFELAESYNSVILLTPPHPRFSPDMR
jgi:hypothetical protein